MAKVPKKIKICEHGGSVFNRACTFAQIPTTMRQHKKWMQGRGAAWNIRQKVYDEDRERAIELANSEVRLAQARAAAKLS